MATFSPIRTPNAIDQAVFVVKLSQNIGEAQLEALKQLENILDGTFENFHEIPLNGIAITADGVSTISNKIIGVECNTPSHQQEHEISSKRSDWILRIIEDSIHINCLSYSNWNDTINFVDQYLTTVFDNISSENLKIIGINLQVNDSFVVKDSIDDLDYSQLFNRSKYLTENTWDIGSLWHVNSGWFDATDYEAALNVLNISTRTNISDSINLIVLIEHLQQYTLIADVPVESKSELIQKVFNELHEKNKVIVNELLAPDIKKQIGLS
jgi:hypothetical protein